MLQYSSRPVLAVLSFLFCPCCLSLTVLCWQPCSVSPVLAALFLAVLAWHLVLPVLSSAYPILAVPFWLSYYSCPVMGDLFWLSSPFVLPLLSFLSGTVLATLSWQPCLPSPVLAVLSWKSSHGGLA